VSAQSFGSQKNNAPIGIKQIIIPRIELDSKDKWKIDPTYTTIFKYFIKYAKNPIVDNGADKNQFKKIVHKKISKDYEITGIDILDNQGLDKVYDGLHLPFKDCSINTFISNFVLEHIENENMYLSEMHRSLKKGGVVILTVPRPVWYLAAFISPILVKGLHYNAMKAMIRLKNPFREIVHGRPGVHSLFEELRLWKEERFEELFRTNDFKIIEKERSDHVFALDPRYAIFTRKIILPDFLKISVTYVLKK